MDVDSEDELIQYAKECHASAMAVLASLRETEEKVRMIYIRICHKVLSLKFFYVLGIGPDLSGFDRRRCQT